MKILQGDCREKLREMEESSIDAIVTDPPYGLEFMGKDWDASWKTDRRQNFDGTLKDQRENPYGRSKVRNGGGASYGADARVMQALQEWYYSWAIECLRVLKPGGHLLSFGGSRTYHRMACAIEDAGFEIRDQIMWITAQGFPKSLNLPGGFGTALKPAHEDLVLAQKPYDLCGICGILAQKILEGLCRLPSFAKDVKSNSTFSRSVFVEGFDFVQWNAVVKCSTPDALFVLMDMWPSELAIPSSLNIGLSWLGILDGILRQQNTFTTETRLGLTTDLKTLNSLLSQNTPNIIIEAAMQRDGIGSNVSLVTRIFSAVESRLEIIRALSAPDLVTLLDLQNSPVAGVRTAHEPICVARKPIEGTVAANVLKWGTGALNIDGCRVEYLSEADKASATPQGECTAKVGALAGGTQNETERSAFERPEQKGRWPANVIHDGSEEVLAAFPNAPGQCADVKYDAEERKPQNIYGAMKRGHEPSAERTYEEEGSTNFAMKPGARRLDQGSAARFFKACEFSEYELLLCRAKAIMESWNPDFASTVNNSLSLSESHVVSALSDAVTLVSHGGIRLKDLTVLSMNVTPAELRMLCESVIVTILSSEIKSWPASFRFDTGRLNGSLVNGAEALERIGTTTTTASRMSSGGCAAVATFDSTWSNTAVGEVGSPSRVFYCAKTSKAERGEGNSHPTVKPIALMRYLCKLVTPPGGVVLDPFMGSGSTGLAAIREGFEFIGIELNPDYIKMANSRLLAEILK